MLHCSNKCTLYLKNWTLNTFVNNCNKHCPEYLKCLDLWHFRVLLIFFNYALLLNCQK